MKKLNDPLEKVFQSLEDTSIPTEKQKDKMLKQILLESRLYDDSTYTKIRRLISVYPWRFAFGVSTVQSVVFTLIFGTGYTNLFLNMFGG